MFWDFSRLPEPLPGFEASTVLFLPITQTSVLQRCLLPAVAVTVNLSVIFLEFAVSANSGGRKRELLSSLRRMGDL